MALVKAGVPWHEAEKMNDWQLFGFQVIAGELDGGQFDWRTKSWRERK
jgi:hypothetical protein